MATGVYTWPPESHSAHSLAHLRSNLLVELAISHELEHRHLPARELRHVDELPWRRTGGGGVVAERRCRRASLGAAAASASAASAAGGCAREHGRRALPLSVARRVGSTGGAARDEHSLQQLPHRGHLGSQRVHLAAHERAARQHGVLRERAHDSNELLRVEGLAHVRGRAGAVASDAVGRQPTRREQHNRRAAQPSVRAHSP